MNASTILLSAMIAFAGTSIAMQMKEKQMIVAPITSKIDYESQDDQKRYDERLSLFLEELIKPQESSSKLFIERLATYAQQLDTPEQK